MVEECISTVEKTECHVKLDERTTYYVARVLGVFLSPGATDCLEINICGPLMLEGEHEGQAWSLKYDLSDDSDIIGCFFAAVADGQIGDSYRKRHHRKKDKVHLQFQRIGEIDEVKLPRVDRELVGVVVRTNVVSGRERIVEFFPLGPMLQEPLPELDFGTKEEE